MLAERVKCRASEIVARETDGGERGKRELRKIDVIEANDRKVMRHTKSFKIGGTQDADRGHVVGADDGSRPLCERLELAEAGNTPFERVVALNDPFFLNWKLRLFH